MLTSILTSIRPKPGQPDWARPAIELFRLLVLLPAVGLLGCQSAPTHISLSMPATPACKSGGTVELATLEEAERGYAYQFQVYLPPCYDSLSEKKYPVLFLIPGRGSGAGAWFTAGVDRIADGLILSGQVPPFLIIAAEATDVDPQAETLANELIPFVEEQYPIRTDRRYRAVAGASLGGIGAYRLVFRRPEQFGSLGMFGSGIMPGEEDQVLLWLNAVPASERPRVFLNTGEQDVATLPWAQATMELLSNEGIESRSVLTPGQHSYVYWASNFRTYLSWVAEEW